MPATTYTYDYLIVGSGLFGSVFAWHAKQKGKRVLVIEKRSHKGGSVYCHKENGIWVHAYGAHIFHTNSKEIWEFVNQFTSFEPYRHKVLSKIGGNYYPFPVNYNSLGKLWGLQGEGEIQTKLDLQKASYSSLAQATNAEDWLLYSAGKELYDTFFAGYTEKQWKRPPAELPASIVKRVPLRHNRQDDYFDDDYQAMPVNGYNELIDNLLDGIELRCDTDFFDQKENWEQMAERIVYTGPIDQLFNFDLGQLDYRSLQFEHRQENTANYQPVSVVNYPEKQVPYTREIEHKHFHKVSQTAENTIVTREYPQDFVRGKNEPYYPIRDEKNMQLYADYVARIDTQKYLLGGRLAEFRYYDMHQVVASAITKAKKELGI
jgi:UDP-galactopyranose mutase